MSDFSLHVEAMAWLRFGRRMTFVCSEAGPFNADVLGADDKQLIEVEVKKSRADFRKDFDKVRKHELYGNPPPGKGLWVPNQFFFIVAADLREAGLEILEENKSPAGLLVVERPITAIYGAAGRHVGVAKRAKQIHDRVPSSGIIRELGKRMSSEITTMRLRLEDMCRDHLSPDSLSAILDEQRLAMKEMAATPDWSPDEEKL